MDKITKEEFEKTEGVVRGRRSDFWAKVATLEVDFGFKIKREDWSRRTSPVQLISARTCTTRRSHDVLTERKFICKTLPNNEGWLILRTA